MLVIWLRWRSRLGERWRYTKSVVNFAFFTTPVEENSIRS